MRPMPARLSMFLLAALATGCTCGGDAAPEGTAIVVTDDMPEVPAAPPEKGQAPEGAPNVLLVIWDTVRADRLSAYGYHRPTTPALEAFAKQGVVYERAVSPGMWTLPSHSSMFTGLPVSAHGANAEHKWLDNRFTTMAEWLGQHGYDTYLFSANPYLGDHTNVGQGFDVREHPWTKRWKKQSLAATMGKILPDDASNFLAPKWKQSIYKTGRSNDKTKDAGSVAGKALKAFIEERKEQDRPWFATLNYMEAHVPRIPSIESRKALFDDARIQQQLTLDQSYGFLLAYTLRKYEFTDEEVSIISDTYDATLRDLDTATAELFALLDARGELDNTIVIITADHGEHLGEHHRIGHKYSVYNPLVRVPLVIRYPKGLSPDRVSKVVSNLSIFATVTDLAGLGMPEGTSSVSLTNLDNHTGVAFSELVAATPQALHRIGKVHKDLDRAPWMRTYASVETTDAKCIDRSDGHRELYAMPDDALETTNLEPAESERAAQTCGLIGAWRGTFPAYDKASAEAIPDLDEADDELKQRLEMLGYVQGDDEDEDEGAGGDE